MTLDWMPEPMRALVEKATEPQRVAATLWAESRSEPVQGIIAVANVIRNRTLKPKRFGATFSDVVTAPKQFSCWTPDGGERNYQRLLTLMGEFVSGAPITDAGARECIVIAHGITGNYFRDNVKGSTHYHTATLTPRPTWAQRHVPATQVGGHVFYNDVQ